MAEDFAAIAALAEAWAAVDGKLVRFRANQADRSLDYNDGTYPGYIEDARSLLERVQMRGYVLTPLPEPTALGPVFFYEREFYPLSNFSAFSLEWNGLTFQTSEAAYQYEKFHARPDIQRRILHAPSAHEAFKIAEQHQAERYPNWEGIREHIMFLILSVKVRQHEYVRRKLMQTGDRDLIEDSWRDNFWGWGPNKDGKNMLGKLWMQVRAELRRD